MTLDWLLMRWSLGVGPVAKWSVTGGWTVPPEKSSNRWRAVPSLSKSLSLHLFLSFLALCGGENCFCLVWLGLVPLSLHWLVSIIAARNLLLLRGGIRFSFRFLLLHRLPLLHRLLIEPSQWTVSITKMSHTATARYRYDLFAMARDSGSLRAIGAVPLEWNGDVTGCWWCQCFYWRRVIKWKKMVLATATPPFSFYSSSICLSFSLFLSLSLSLFWLFSLLTSQWHCRRSYLKWSKKKV